jgi:hypothetical protein
MADDHEVTNVTQETQLAESGAGFRPVYKVNYKVTGGPAEGTVGHIIVPASQYDAPTVRAALASAVQKHQDVHSI